MIIGKVDTRCSLCSLVIHSLLLIMASSNLCVVCNKVVGPRQEGFICNICKHWQHRTCNSGIDRTFYRRAVKEKLDLPLICSACKSKVHCFLILILILILFRLLIRMQRAQGYLPVSTRSILM